jgi:hypothetical protein
MLTLGLAVIAAGFLIRTFIIMHDCGHGSFFRSRRANDIVGFITGVLTLTPYTQWRRDHAIHHATSGDLEERGHGDVSTLTVREYLGLVRPAPLPRLPESAGDAGRRPRLADGQAPAALPRDGGAPGDHRCAHDESDHPRRSSCCCRWSSAR